MVSTCIYAILGQKLLKMGLCMKKMWKQFGFSTSSDIHRAKQAQKKARSLKLWIHAEEELYSIR